MRKRHVLFLAFLTAPFVCGPATGADTDLPLVTVNGHAEVRVIPDEVIVSLGVQTFDPELSKAKAENDSRVTAVLAAAEALDIPREHIRTEHVDLRPVYRDYHETTSDFLHYRVRKTLVITLRDIDKFEALLSAALEAGATHVHSVDFRTTELRKHRDHARALAIVAAREKAEALAKELGVSIGDVHTIREDYARWWSGYGSWWGGRGGGGMTQNVVQVAGAQGGDAEGPTVPGQIAVDARVTASFVLKD